MVAPTFKPAQIIKKLLSALPERSRAVIESRYGLGKTTERLTLEAIGKKYNITRERVRQIENHALQTLRKSSAMKEAKAAFDELEDIVDTLGGLVPEEEFLRGISANEQVQNHIHFLLVVGESFKKDKEDDECKTCWYVDEELTRRIRESLRRLYETLSDETLVPESELIGAFLVELKDINQKYKSDEIIRRWLSLSKSIGKNPLGEWGRAHSPNVRTKGVRDYAYLAIKRHGSPMHFTEVAKMIEKLFNKRAHVATTHNELIKDPRFVLVGRGLYALAEWGYNTGVVRDVIREILKKEGPLPRTDIIEKVRKERYVKDNTIVVNLQNSKFFRKTKEGKYSLV